MKNSFAILMILSLLSCNAKKETMIIKSPSGIIKAAIMLDGKNVFYRIK